MITLRFQMLYAKYGVRHGLLQWAASVLHISYSTIEEAVLTIDPITPAIGAEIRGLDMTQALSPEIHDAIYQALLDHQVIFIRDANISPAAHLGRSMNRITVVQDKRQKSNSHHANH